jgi:hypothetical protein
MAMLINIQLEYGLNEVISGKINEYGNGLIDDGDYFTSEICGAVANLAKVLSQNPNFELVLFMPHCGKFNSVLQDIWFTVKCNGITIDEAHDWLKLKVYLGLDKLDNSILFTHLIKGYVDVEIDGNNEPADDKIIPQGKYADRLLLKQKVYSKMHERHFRAYFSEDDWANKTDSLEIKVIYGEAINVLKKMDVTKEMHETIEVLRKKAGVSDKDCYYIMCGDNTAKDNGFCGVYASFDEMFQDMYDDFDIKFIKGKLLLHDHTE